MHNDASWRSPDIVRYVAAAVVMSEAKALVLRRKVDDFMGGIWELPSGKMGSDETIDQALSRELAEETGLTARSVPRMLGTFDYLSKSGRPTRQVNFLVEVSEREVRLSEHDAAEWIDADQVIDWPVTEETRKVLLTAFGEATP